MNFIFGWMKISALRVGASQLIELTLGLFLKAPKVDFFYHPIFDHHPPIDDNRLKIPSRPVHDHCLNGIDKLPQVEPAQVKNRDVCLGARRQPAEVGAI